MGCCMNKFELMLLFMAGRMQYLSHQNAEFMALLHNRQFVIQLQTFDATAVRYFSVKNRRIRSHGQMHPKPDFVLSFKDADYATGLWRCESEWDRTKSYLYPLLSFMLAGWFIYEVCMGIVKWLSR
mgnify:CR=1 FL=1